ncbi:type II secretion system protein GspC [Aliikangiella sp. IMCC44359]|uniref:type II secretion system protein GspC n=1 Tax=Aliikangiella sp. IMCC44359 TaxID=3459125 RepID=UPI00403B2C26
MNFSKLVSASWYKDYNNWLPLVQWLGGLIVVVLLAKTVWVWVLYFTAPSDFKPISVKASSVSQKSNQVDVSSLVHMNLFGSVVKEADVKPEVKDVVETKLNLKLTGIYAADTPDKANAIIEDSRGKQAVYFIGEKLKVGGRVFLRQVYVDRVILESNGRNEALSLEQEESVIKVVRDGDSREKQKSDAGRAPPPPRGKARIDDKRKDDRLSQKLNEYRDKLSSDPKSVSDVISGRPHFVNGELKGFRIQPGKDKRLFQELGLRRNDIVTSINGIGLTNMQDAMTLMNDAKSLKEMNVEIQRGNEQLNLLLNLNQNVGRR